MVEEGEVGAGGSIRRDVERMIEAGDLVGLLYKAGEVHGHLCNYLAYGVKAGYFAMRELGVKSLGMEEVIAMVETNNCFSDGIQITTGCSFGNNALLYKDLGKTAVTVAKRDGTAVRLVLDPDFEDSRGKEYSEAYELWDKIVARREKATPEEQERMMQLFAEMSINELSKQADEMFRVKRLKIAVPEYAPIFTSIRCSICGENVMESRARVKDGKPICMECAKGEHYILSGGGISAKSS